MRHGFFKGSLAGVLALAAASSVQAQEEGGRTSADAVGDVAAASGAGNGIRLSADTVFHPGAELSTGYQTNVFRMDNSDPPDGPVGAAVMRVGVNASIENLPASRLEAEPAQGGGTGRKIAFRGETNLTWNQFFSDDSNLREQSDLGVGPLLDLKLNPDGAFAFTIRDGFVRAVAPPQAYAGDNFEHDRNELMLEGLFKPGGGALQGYVQYRFNMDFFEQTDLD